MAGMGHANQLGFWAAMPPRSIGPVDGPAGINGDERCLINALKQLVVSCGVGCVVRCGIRCVSMWLSRGVA